jgi:hypothetical protein
MHENRNVAEAQIAAKRNICTFLLLLVLRVRSFDESVRYARRNLYPHKLIPAGSPIRLR